MKYQCLFKLCLLCFVFGTMACYDDQGNYDYHKINEVAISNIMTDGVYDKIAFVDTLKINPVITSTFYQDKTDKYKYEWKIIPFGANTSTEEEIVDYVVSREKNLNYPVSLTAGNYNCFYAVKDTISGITWRQGFSLKVRTITSDGWMVLCEQEGECRLDMVVNLTEDEDMIGRDLWANNEFRTGKPINMLYNAYSRGSARLLICENGTYDLDYTDLHMGEDKDFKWRFGTTPSRVDIRASGQVQYSNVKQFWVVVDKDGEAYSLNLGEPGSVFEYPINKLDGVTPFVAAPFVGVSWISAYRGHSVLMYDNTGKQFIEIIDGASYPSVMKFSGTQLFDVHTGKDFVYGESTKNGYNYVILQDPTTKKYYFYCISLKAKGENIQEYYGEIKGADLNQVKYFACHHLYTYLFYATDHAVYQIDMTHPENAAEHSILDYPAPEAISVLRFNPFVAWGISYDNWEKARGYDLVVGTNLSNESESDCGIMRTYSVPNLMGSLVKKKEHKQLGKIVAIAYREAGK